MSTASRLPTLVSALALLLGLTSFAPFAAAARPSDAELRAWIGGFKAAPRGPFERIRWFCKDGTVLPPKAYACKNHGGGIQHGEWNQRAKDLRASGYTVANVLASVDPKQFVGGSADLLALEQILLERFLIGYDDGWIFRGARSYRGAFQIEDEEAGAQAIVHAMLGDPAWRKPERFLLLRETVRWMPLPANEQAAAVVRQQALVLAGKEKAFMPLRAKIHNLPDAGDAAKVRAYAKTKGRANLRGEYERLAKNIDGLFSGAGAAKLTLGEKLEGERDPTTRIAIAGHLMSLLRKHLPGLRDPEVATEALQLSVVLEDDATAAGRAARSGISSLSKSRRLELLDQSAEALYGAGLITLDQLSDVKKARQRGKRSVLGKPPEWAERALDTTFDKAIDHLAPLEPKARSFVPERTKKSLVPFYGNLADNL